MIKQALPYVRCVGESWPLTLERATFEHAALVEQQVRLPLVVLVNSNDPLSGIGYGDYCSHSNS